MCLRRAVLLTISSHNTRLPTCDLRGELLCTGQGQHDHAIHLQLNTVFLVKPINSSMPCWFWAIPQVRWLIAEKISLRTGAAGEMVLESMLLLAFPQEHGNPNKVFFLPSSYMLICWLIAWGCTKYFERHWEPRNLCICGQITSGWGPRGTINDVFWSWDQTKKTEEDNNRKRTN